MYRGKLYNILEEIGVPKKLIRLTKMTLTNTKYKVSVAESLIAESLMILYYLNSGVRQGDPLSTVLFNIVLEYIKRERINYNFCQKPSMSCICERCSDIGPTKKNLIKAMKLFQRKAMKVVVRINKNTK